MEEENNYKCLCGKEFKSKKHYLGISLPAQHIWNLLENFNGTYVIFVEKNL